jgi:hypothetical protein
MPSNSTCAEEFFESDAFAENPVGVLFDPDELAARFEAGEPVAELVKRPWYFVRSGKEEADYLGFHDAVFN